MGHDKEKGIGRAWKKERVIPVNRLLSNRVRVAIAWVIGVSYSREKQDSIWFRRCARGEEKKKRLEETEAMRVRTWYL